MIRCQNSHQGHRQCSVYNMQQPLTYFQLGFEFPLRNWQHTRPLPLGLHRVSPGPFPSVDLWICLGSKMLDQPPPHCALLLPHQKPPALSYILVSVIHSLFNLYPAISWTSNSKILVLCLKKNVHNCCFFSFQVILSDCQIIISACFLDFIWKFEVIKSQFLGKFLILLSDQNEALPSLKNSILSSPSPFHFFPRPSSSKRLFEITTIVSYHDPWVMKTSSN